MSLFRIRLNDLLSQTDKTQTEICKDLDIKKQKLTQWKTGYIEPNIDDLIILANYFHVTIDFLVGNKNEECYELEYKDNYTQLSHKEKK